MLDVAQHLGVVDHVEGHLGGWAGFQHRLWGGLDTAVLELSHRRRRAGVNVYELLKGVFRLAVWGEQAVHPLVVPGHPGVQEGLDNAVRLTQIGRC